MVWETVKLAMQAILRNALRSFLTLLGIVIGVGAVIAMVTIGNGTTAKVTEDLEKLGANLLVIRPGQSRLRGPGGASTAAKAFDLSDVEALRQQLYGAQAVSPLAAGVATAVYGAENWNTTVMGVDNAYFTVQEWQLGLGRQFLPGELRAGRAVCVIGQTVKSELFGAANPIGARIRLKKMSCEVIGILEAKGQSSFGTDQDDRILIPLRAFQRRIAGNTDVGNIFVAVKDGVDSVKVQVNVERILRERRNVSPGEEDDFFVRDMRQIVETLTATTTLLTGLLGAVAAVSLLVGGIGIMNIMLVSVTERTREIGIRLAIGALESQVLMQFLIEAAVLSLFGGLIGILLGLGLAAAASAGLNIPFILDPTIIAVAFLFSALIGVVFGYFPARRAAQLDPIDALRHE